MGKRKAAKKISSTSLKKKAVEAAPENKAVKPAEPEKPKAEEKKDEEPVTRHLKFGEMMRDK